LLVNEPKTKAERGQKQNGEVRMHAESTFDQTAHSRRQTNKGSNMPQRENKEKGKSGSALPVLADKLICLSTGDFNAWASFLK